MTSGTHTQLGSQWATDWFKCPECGEIWAVHFNIIQRFFRPTKINALLADMELTAQIHRTNHEIDKLTEYVKAYIQ